MTRCDIFAYQDFREYLLAYFDLIKKTNPRYSLRSFSNKIGFKSKDFISRVMKGEKNLTPSSISKIAVGLSLSSSESQYFESLVLFCQATSKEERAKYSDRVSALRKASQFTKAQTILKAQQYDYYSHWQHSAIRSLIGMHGFDGNYKALGAKLHPKISAAKAQQSVSLLAQLELIAQQENGQWVISSPSISSGNQVPLLAIQSFHTDCLTLARQAIESLPTTDYNISGVTLGISRQKYAQIVERLNEFRKEIAMMTEEDLHADQVYQLNLQLFPMAKL